MILLSRYYLKEAVFPVFIIDDFILDS